LVEAFVEVNGSGIKIAFKGFVFVPEHTSGSEMSIFNAIYELSDKGEKLLTILLESHVKQMVMKLSTFF
jgi:hypothetical protein